MTWQYRSRTVIVSPGKSDRSQKYPKNSRAQLCSSAGPPKPNSSTVDESAACSSDATWCPLGDPFTGVPQLLGAVSESDASAIQRRDRLAEPVLCHILVQGARASRHVRLKLCGSRSTRPRPGNTSGTLSSTSTTLPPSSRSAFISHMSLCLLPSDLTLPLGGCVTATVLAVTEGRRTPAVRSKRQPVGERCCTEVGSCSGLGGLEWPN